MNYSVLSDFEINSTVTAIVCNCQKWEFDCENGIFYHCGIDGNGYYEQRTIDFCNSPANAWPIILENEISIIRDVSTNDVWEALPKGWVTMNGFESSIDNKLSCINKNPLRAAMIVFLMMSDK